MNEIDFSNTQNAFQYKTNQELYRAFVLFNILKFNFLVNFGKKMLEISLKLHLPVQFIIKRTIFSHFVGGETIEDCSKNISRLSKYGIGTILDYSVEGKGREEDFDRCEHTVISTILMAENNTSIPFSVFKVTGLAPFSLLEKFSNPNEELHEADKAEYEAFFSRVDRICKKAHDCKVPVFIDAEESWIQPCIDRITEAMMQKYNTQQAIVFNTLQMYRTDRLNYLKNSIAHAREHKYFVGYKIVRGAYMEKERERAILKNYISPIQPDKDSTDTNYNDALSLCMAHIDFVSICAGTHNENSCRHLLNLMEKNQICESDNRIWFAQLYGMSDHISFNLSIKGYRVAKYLPFGPVNDVMPYLIRRAEENTSIAGQTGRELSLLSLEINRRKQEQKK